MRDCGDHECRGGGGEGEQPAEQEYLAGWAIGYSETSFRQPN